MKTVAGLLCLCFWVQLIPDSTWACRSNSIVLRIGEIPGRIDGIVHDPSGQPIGYANVVILGTRIGDYSRKSGRVAMPLVPLGTYSLRASFVGYEPVTVENVQVEAGATSVVRFCFQRKTRTARVLRVTNRPVQLQTPNAAGSDAQVVVRGEPFLRCEEPTGKAYSIRQGDRLLVSSDSEALVHCQVVSSCGGSYSVPEEVQAGPEEERVLNALSSSTCGQSIVLSQGTLPLESEKETPSQVTRLMDNAPNPFNPTTEIRFQLAGAAAVEVSIYDVKGQLVRTLVREPLEAGRHASMWNGRDDRGRSVASGVYFYHLRAGDFAATRKMVLVR